MVSQPVHLFVVIFSSGSNFHIGKGAFHLVDIQNNSLGTTATSSSLLSRVTANFPTRSLPWGLRWKNLQHYQLRQISRIFFWQSLCRLQTTSSWFSEDARKMHETVFSFLSNWRSWWFWLLKFAMDSSEPHSLIFRERSPAEVWFQET